MTEGASERPDALVTRTPAVTCATHRAACGTGERFLPSVGLVQPSSLIFVLVVAIWAVYLLQYWVKRRDHLSTVRSVDRFSAAMRVLDDHRMRRETAEPTPRSYTVAPTRAARPKVTVKHAEAPRRGPIAQPVVGASRRVRGVTLLLMVALLPVVALVAVLGPLPWWSALAWLVGTLAAFGWLRQVVRAEREVARRDRVSRRPQPRPEPTRRPQQAADAGATPRPATASAASAATASGPAEVPARAATPVFDVADVEPEAEESVTAPLAAEPGTWQPAPVPPPMYSMKAKAERPAPASPPAEEPAAEVPQVIDVEDEELPALAGWG